ncbi:MAG: alpha/beta fold hydrolase [Marinobacter sp.]|nr:alpha/beta fold hydrolase [Marinobacter sp.]
MKDSGLISNGETGPALVLAHGAGAPMDSLFMERLAVAIAREGCRVFRFEFPYMQKRRGDGRKRPPDRMPALEAAFCEAVADVRDEIGPKTPLFVGGKSMGGRVASLLCASRAVAAFDLRGGLVFGYPFHPPGRNDNWRTDHFAQLQCPLTIFQGTRDPFGRQQELAEQSGMLQQVQIHWLAGGEHDFKPLKATGRVQAELIAEAAAGAARIMLG